MSIEAKTLVTAGVMAVAVHLSPSAFAQSPAASTAAPGTSTSASAKGNAIARSDRKMLVDIAQANLAEIETGKLALEKSSNASVKQFAQQMVDDHGKALKEVAQLAQEKGVEMPDGPDIKHKAKATALKAMKGNTFDKHYISDAGLDDHRATVKLLKKTSSDAKDADLKALADKLLPTVESHLQHAQQLGRKG